MTKKIVAAVAMLSLATLPILANGSAERRAATDEPVEISFFQYLAFASRVVSSADEIVAYQIMEERLGIDIDWIHPADTDVELSLMVASGDMADLIQSDWNAYSGGIQKAYDDGLIVSLNEYLERGYAPNYSALLSENETFRKDVISDGGNYLGFTRYEPGFPERPYIGFMVRLDWLEQVGLGLPRTMDEWKTAMRAFRSSGLIAEDGYALGTAARPYGRPFVSMLAPAYGVLDEDFMIDPETGRVVYPRGTNEYREFIADMLAMIDEGLIDPEGLLMDTTTYRAAMINGEYGVTYTFENRFEMFNVPGAENDPDFMIGAAPFPMHESGRQYAGFDFDRTSPGLWTTVSSDSQEIEAAMRWVDYGFTQEGADLLNWGVLGESYEVVDGKKQYIVSGDERFRWAKAGNGTSRLMDIQASFASYTPWKIEQTAIWAEGADYSLFIPNRLTFTPEESREAARIKPDIDTYTEETLQKILLGVESLDVWDEYVATLDSLGVDRLVAIVQTAYDRYLAR